MQRFAGLISVAATLAAATGTLAQCQVQKLTASDADENDRFGISVSISSDRAIVGALFGDAPGAAVSGAAYVFRFDGTSWTQEQKLTASDAATGDVFGRSVSVSAHLAVVGAAGDVCAGGGSECGAAYVYRFNGSSWVEEQKLTASDAAPAGDLFGISVSVSGDLAVVGAPGDDDACPFSQSCNSGSAYVFEKVGGVWTQAAKLTAADGAFGDNFGGSVSVSGNLAVVGAHGDECAPGIDCGAAYVFRYDGTSWVQEQKLIASDAPVSGDFGRSVFVSGGLAVAGAPGDDGAIGSAYVYRFNGSTWVEEQKLTASDAGAAAEFGIAVSVSGDVAVVGAFGDFCPAGTRCGAAYVYRSNGPTWVEEQKLTASDAAAEDGLGISVSISGDVAVVGSSSDDCADPLPNCGAAYVFAVPSPTAPDCNGNGVPDKCDIADGTAQDQNGDGIPDECELVESDCANGIDDDADGDIDCEDTDCAAQQVCQEDCANGLDDDVDGDIDCEDSDCCDDPICQEDCTNGIDDDLDDDTDCEDSDCAEHPACQEDCTNGLDDDVDGDIDCDDADCFVDPACQENCSNGIDDDLDGDVDCEDADCIGQPACP